MKNKIIWEQSRLISESKLTTTLMSHSSGRRGVPSQYTKYFPSVGKVFVLNNFHPATSYLPYIGHTNFVSSYGSGAIHPVHVIRVRPSVVIRELDRIEHKYRPALTYSPYDSYTKSAYIQKKNDGVLKNFEDEKRLIRRQTDALLKRVHQPVPRVTVRIMPTGSFQRYYDETPLRIKVMSDNYLSRMFSPIKQMADNIYNISYYSEPARKYIGPGHLACIRYAGNKAYPKRRHLSDLTFVRNDINLLSYYLKNRKAAGPYASYAIPKQIADEASILDPLRPSRIFSAPRQLPDPADERKEVEALKAAQKARLIESAGVDTAAQIRQKKLEAKVAEEKALAEERARQKEQAKAEEKAKAAEASRKKELEAQAEAQRQAEVEKQRKEEAEKEAQRIEKARKEEEARQALEAKKAAEEEAAKKAAEEAAKKAAEEEAAKKAAEEEAAKKAAEEEAARKAEEERKQLERLEEIARQAEEEKEKELKRQAEELAELARQQAETTEEAPAETEAPADAEPASPPAEAEDTGAESVDEQAELPAEGDPETPAVEAEPVVEEPATPEINDAAAAEEEEEEE